MTTAYQVRDGAIRTLEFDGDLLASQSSWRPGSPRWMELKLFKTTNGVYVLSKIGRSMVVHSPDCEIPRDQFGNRPELPRFQEMHPGADPFTPEFFVCEECEAGGADGDFTRIEIEEDRYFAAHSDDPRDMIEELYRRKGGAKSLQRMAVDLLEEASKNDEGIARAFQASFIL